MLRTLDLRGQSLSPAELLAAVPRATAARSEALATAARLVDDVASRGEAALREQAEQFDGVTGHDIRVPASHLDEALEQLDPAVRAALEQAIDRVRAASAVQVPPPTTTTLAPGALVHQRWQPVRRVGVYVPGGKASYPSSVLMNAIPAKVAGVPEVVMVVPTPRGEINELVLAAACLHALIEGQERSESGMNACGVIRDRAWRNERWFLKPTCSMHHSSQRESGQFSALIIRVRTIMTKVGDRGNDQVRMTLLEGLNGEAPLF